MPSLTNPAVAEQQQQQQALAQGQMPGAATTPMLSGLGAAPGGEAIAAVSSGIATSFWVELAAYPPGSARSLWLQVAGSWKRYDNSPAHWEDMVQSAFANGQTVRVWHDGSKIVGLVINS
jgi:hypothetical protein